MAIFIYILFLGGWLFLNCKKNGFNSGSFLIFIYFLGAVLGVYILFFYNIYDLDRIRFAPIIYHTVCLFLFLSPLVYYSNRIGLNYKFPSEQILKVFTIVCIVACSFTIISCIPKLQSVFAVEDLAKARNMYNYGVLYEEESGGIVDYIGVIGTAFAMFSLFLFFHYLRFAPHKYWLLIVLLICSLSDAVFSFTAVGRGGVMRWLLMFLYFFFLFRPAIPKHIIRKVGKYVLIFSTPMLIVFGWITISRFSGREYPLVFYLFDYIGQSFIYFSYIFDDFFESTFGGRMNFRFLFPTDARVDRVLANEVYTDYHLNTFATFIGSFYKDMGFVRTLSLAFIFYISSIFMLRFNRDRNNFIQLTLFIIFSMIIINGVFYFQYTGTTTMRSFILIILFSCFTTWAYTGKKLVFKD